MKNLTLATKRYAPVMQHPGDVHQSATATPLLHLPNELLLQVASYLAATPHIQEIARKDFKFERSFTSSSSQTLLNHLGYCRKHPPQPPVSRTVKYVSRDLEGFANSFTSSSDLSNLALTCKHLATIAQEVLYKDVILPQRRVKDSTRCPRLVSFLRTLIERPELASRTQSLAVWILKSTDIVILGQGLCTCSTCLLSLRKIVGCVEPQASFQDDWIQRYIHQPTEAQVCSLIFAALPNLTTVKLHRVTIDRNSPTSEWWDSFMDLRVAQDAKYLTAGLAAAKVDTLSLSAECGRIFTAGLPNIKTLMVGYGPDSRPVVTNQCFPNVTTLKIRGGSSFLQNPSCQANFEQILASFPSAKTLVLLETKPCRAIPSHIKHIILRNRARDERNLSWCFDHLKNLHSMSALRRIDVDWDGFMMGFRATETELDNLANSTGVHVVVWRKGEVLKDCRGTS